MALLLAAAACAGPSVTPTPVPTTGVWGVALAGPTCPVERPGQSPCHRPVVGAEIVALDADGRQAGRAITNAQGFYSLPLAPGSYTIEPQPVEGLLGTAGPVSVEVAEGLRLVLNLDYDTGIR
jgi:hypothetical protein